MGDKKQNWFVRHKVLTAIIVVFAVIVVVSAVSSSVNKTDNTQPENTTQTAQPAQNQPEEKPAARQVQGQATRFGAGTFTGGKDVAVGLYDVTAGSGESGNLIVNGGVSYNEVLGSEFGVDKVRVKIAEGDNIQISGLSTVTFTPVTSAFVTERKAIDLYAGTFIVGEDIAAGRYDVTPGSGQSGNFIVNNGASYNEILGSEFGVPSVAVDLSKDDEITISGLSQATFTPIE